VIPPPRATAEATATVERLTEELQGELLPHQSVLVFDEHPRVNTGQRIDRAVLLRSPKMIVVSNKTKM
jgi:hypothetical protein